MTVLKGDIRKEAKFLTKTNENAGDILRAGGVVYLDAHMYTARKLVAVLIDKLGDGFDCDITGSIYPKYNDVLGEPKLDKTLEAHAIDALSHKIVMNVNVKTTEHVLSDETVGVWKSVDGEMDKWFSEVGINFIKLYFGNMVIGGSDE